MHDIHNYSITMKVREEKKKWNAKSKDMREQAAKRRKK